MAEEEKKEVQAEKAETKEVKEVKQGKEQKTEQRGERKPRGRKNERRDRKDRRDDKKDQNEMIEKMVFLNRCAKVVKGGRRYSFAALMVVGDGKGHVGMGLGKAAEVPEAVRKGIEDAKEFIRKNADLIKEKINDLSKKEAEVVKTEDIDPEDELKGV